MDDDFMRCIFKDDIVKDSTLPEGVPDIEVKAFYDILVKVAEQHNFAEKFNEEQFANMANCVKAIVDDKSKYVDCFKRDDIRAAMQVDIIIELSKHGFPPVSHNDIYKAIMEQAENFKKNISHPHTVVFSSEGYDETQMAAEHHVQFTSNHDKVTIQSDHIDTFIENNSNK